MKFKVGSRVEWKWLGRVIPGVVLEVHLKSVSKTIKGKTIRRNGSEEKPAYLVESAAGNLALKLVTELAPASKSNSKKSEKNPKPRMFADK